MSSLAAEISAPPSLRRLKLAGARQVKLDGRVFWSTGGRVIAWIEEFCIFTNGRWTGDPFVLLPWQKKLIWELFEVDQRTSLRVYRRALIGLPRKSGKTELAAAITLYLAFAEGERSAEVYCAASSEEQADMPFRACERMVEHANSRLTPYVRQGVKDRNPALYSIEDNYSYIVRLSSKGKTKHGLNVHAALLDELHVWGVGEHTELWAALTTGSAARLQPMQLAITTAGTDKENSRCGELYELGRRIQRGETGGKHGGFFFRWWQAPEYQCGVCDTYLYDGEICRVPDHREVPQRKTPYDDPAIWKLASPSYGYTVQAGFYEQELMSTTEADFRRLYLNQWVPAGSTPWLRPGMWAACDVGPFDFQPGGDSVTGVDLSESRDSTAVATGQLWYGDERPCGHTGPPCLYVKLKAWEAPLMPDGKPDLDYQIPQAEVKEHIRHENSEFSVRTNVFDPWHSKLMRQDLAGEGMTVEEIWQTGARRSGATASLFDRIVQKRLHHDGDPVLTRHIANATTKPASGGEGYYLAKRKRGAVMDGAMALVNVEYGFINAEAPKGPSVYETRGILSL